MRKLLLAGTASALAACSVLGGVATFVASPAGQALITGVEAFFPGLTSAANNAVANSATQADLKMVCGGYSYASTLVGQVNPTFVSSVTWQAINAQVQQDCANPPPDINGAILDVAAAVNSAIVASQAAGVPVAAPKT